MNLLIAQCSPQREAIAAADLEGWLQQVPGWKLAANGDTIECRFEFHNFYQTMAFVNAVAEIAHGQDHHPEMQVSFDACALSLSTLSAKGLTSNDFICAAQISALPEGSV
ncbi:4a-hydroxytetrahydrobiopterin dehydratase [Paucibacter sp. B2R-40]|uniref:4a-hydroxytetrahydrobiopterin dehydratase n=1 Tax=Paucibacter sp. B2R-40 TaxID=2893554 RepID=UPI0021E4E9BB|nr:4a-hydroxytetrahydrobiopterin dehydratase [Paucibacter sp. B2R-40]